MKNKLIFIFLIVFIGSNKFAFSQADAAATVQQTVWMKINEAAKMAYAKSKDKIREINEHKLIAETGKLIKLYQDTKELTGVIASSTKDLMNMTKIFYKDLGSVHTITKMELNQLTSFLSFKDALRGNGYPSMLNASAWYEDETREYRSPDGFLSVSSAILNATSAEAAVAKMNRYNGQLMQYRQNRIYVMDNQIRQLIAAANNADRMARLKVLKLNVKMFGKKSKDVFKGAGQIGRSYGDIVQDFEHTEKLSGQSDDPTVKKPEDEFREEMEEIDNLIQEAEIYRNKAFELYAECQRLQQPSITHAQDVIRARLLREAYKEVQYGRSDRMNNQSPGVNPDGLKNITVPDF